MLRLTNDIGAAVDQEKRRRPRRDVQSRRELDLVLRLQVSRVNRNSEIRPTTDFGNIIHGFISPLLKARRLGRCQMASRRETNYADALRIDAPVLRAAAH